MWIILAAGAQGIGLRPETVKVASQMALIPIWFLAVYVFVVVLVPISYTAWQRYGFRSFGILVLAAVIDDLLFFAADLQALGWLNYAFVWLAVHQLGYAWRDGYMAGARQGLTWAIGGAVVLAGLITIGHIRSAWSVYQARKSVILCLRKLQCWHWVSFSVDCCCRLKYRCAAGCPGPSRGLLSC